MNIIHSNTFQYEAAVPQGDCVSWEMKITWYKTRWYKVLRLINVSGLGSNQPIFCGAPQLPGIFNKTSPYFKPCGMLRHSFFFGPESYPIFSRREPFWNNPACFISWTRVSFGSEVNPLLARSTLSISLLGSMVGAEMTPVRMAFDFRNRLFLSFAVTKRTGWAPLRDP